MADRGESKGEGWQLNLSVRQAANETRQTFILHLIPLVQMSERWSEATSLSSGLLLRSLLT